MMKAYSLHGIGNLVYEDVPVPSCPEGWVIVEVKATGICSSDIPRIFTKGTYHFPTIPGHEFAGVVAKVADGANESLLGQHVGVFPLIPCRQCSQCESHHYEMCEHYDYVGSRRDGAFAQYVAVPVWNLVLLENTLPFIHAAMLEPLSVALHAIKISGVKQGDSVGIIGTGMIGISAAQWARWGGASKIKVIGRGNGKRQLVESCGVEYEACKGLDELGQYDIVIEAVGTPDAIEQAIFAARPGGVIVLMGNPSGDIPFKQDTYWRVLRKQLTLKGTWNSSYDGIQPSDWTDAVGALTRGELNVAPLVTHVFDQSDVMEGLVMMRNHKEPYCKVMTIWNNGDSVK
ncbi:MAG: galactitol-1-phosphate 5-dehydrogenase [Prevotella sp.]|nr:galactitol-1-phosphate 5-dehydrogenase [Prevotella sp.]